MNMVALREKIEDSGMKMTAIAEKSGITRATLYNKLDGKSEFTVSEITSLANTLHMTEDEVQYIFLESG